MKLRVLDDGLRELRFAALYYEARQNSLGRDFYQRVSDYEIDRERPIAICSL